MLRHLVAVGVISIVLAGPVSANEPRSRGEQSEQAKAKAHFRAGSVFFESGAYDEAVREYLEAYRLHPLPDFLFNIAQAYRLKGDRKNALEHYNQFLKHRPNGKGSAEARVHVATLASASGVATGGTGNQLVFSPTATTTESAPDLISDGKEAARPKSTPKWLLWGGVALGVVVVGSLIGIGVNASRPNEQFLGVY